MKRFSGLTSATAAAFLCVACSGSDRSGLEKVGPAADAPTTTTVAAPDYTVKGGENPSTLTVLVGNEYSKVEMLAIIEDVRRQHDDRDEGFFVHVDCDQGDPTRLVECEVPNRTLRRGAHRSGGRKGSRGHGRRQYLPRRGAPPNPPLDPNAVPAMRIVDAMTEAGLPGDDVRDGTKQQCDYVDCVQFIKTEQYSVYQFPDPAMAASQRELLGKGAVIGANIAVFDRVDPGLAPKYESVFAGAMIGR